MFSRLPDVHFMTRLLRGGTQARALATILPRIVRTVLTALATAGPDRYRWVVTDLRRAAGGAVGSSARRGVPTATWPVLRGECVPRQLSPPAPPWCCCTAGSSGINWPAGGCSKARRPCGGPARWRYAPCSAHCGAAACRCGGAGRPSACGYWSRCFMPGAPAQPQRERIWPLAIRQTRPPRPSCYRSPPWRWPASSACC